MALSIFEDAFGRERTKPSGYNSRRRRMYRDGAWTDQTREQEAFTETAARTLGAVQTVCDALIPPSRGRFSVSFGTNTAQTFLDRKVINITAQPLYMKGLRLADVADTFTGFVVHEIGHTEISPATDIAVRAWLEQEPEYKRWSQTIFAIENVLDDEALERWAKARFPGVAHTFRVTTKFVAQDEGLPNKPPRRWDPKADYATRFNFAVIAVRYRWFTRWVADPATRAERQWWIDWADEYADPADPQKRLAGIKAALARIAVRPEDRPEEPKPPEPQPTDEQDEAEPSEDEAEAFDTGDDDSDDDDESDEDEDDADDDDGDGEDADDSDDDGAGDDEADEDEDDDVAPTSGGNDDDDESDEDGDDSDDDGESDDEGDEPSEHEALGEDEDGNADPFDGDDDDEADEGDEPGEDESEGTDESGESEAWGESSDADGEDADDDDERDLDRDDEREREGAELHGDEDDLGQQGEGSSNAPIYEGFEKESLPERDTIKTLDAYVEERRENDKYRDDRLQKEVEVEMKAQKVTDTHGFGTMKVVITL